MRTFACKLSRQTNIVYKQELLCLLSKLRPQNLTQWRCVDAVKLI